MANVAASYIEARNNLLSPLLLTLDECLLCVAKEYSQVIISKEINPYALVQMYYGATTKPYQITRKTERTGLLAGFIVCPQNAPEQKAELRLTINDSQYLAVDEGTPKLSAITKTEKRLNTIYAVIDAEKRYITSDLDIFMILAKSAGGEITFCEDYGYVNALEFVIINSINKLFARELTKMQPKIDFSALELIKHGSANLYPAAKQHYINFPLTAYLPQGDKVLLVNIEGLKKFLYALQQQGYVIELNTNWRL